MNVSLKKLSLEEWKPFSRDAHRISFNHEREEDMDRIDYALVTYNDRELCCYATIIELDKNAAYMQHGGSFPSVAKGVYTVKGYFMFINWLKENYTSISTKIHNENIAMQKLAHSAGLRAVGAYFDEGETFLTYLWKKKKP